MVAALLLLQVEETLQLRFQVEDMPQLQVEDMPQLQVEDMPQLQVEDVPQLQAEEVPSLRFQVELVLLLVLPIVCVQPPLFPVEVVQRLLGVLTLTRRMKPLSQVQPFRAERL